MGHFERLARASADQPVDVKGAKQEDEGVTEQKITSEIVACCVVRNGVMASAVRNTPKTTQG